MRQLANLDAGNRLLLESLADAACPPLVLIGAGCSITAGASTALGMARDLTRLWSSSETRELAESTFEDAMSLIRAGRTVAGSHIDAYLSDLVPTAGHEALVQLVADGFIYPLLLTTNFDDLLEKSFREQGVEPSLYTLGRDSGPWDVTPGRPGVLKLHGDGNDKASMRFLPEDVESIGENDGRLLSDLIGKHGLISIGHRLNDPDLLELLRDIPKIDGLLMAVSPGPVSENATAVLEKHRSRTNTVTSTFDEFVPYLRDALATRRSVVEDAHQLSSLWDELDWTTCTGRRLSTVCPEALERTAEGRGYLLMREWLSPAGGSPLDLRRSLEELQSAIDESSHCVVAKRAEVCARWLWALAQGRSTSHSWTTSTSLSYAAEDAIVEGLNLLELCGGRRSVEVWNLKTAVGEALKEFHTNRRVPLHSNIPVGRECLQRARELLASVVEETGDAPSSGEGSMPIIRARAARHLAVVFEYLGALPGTPRPERNDFNLKWNAYSKLAVQMANDSSLIRIEAYSLLNLSASTLHLAELGEQVAESGTFDSCEEWLNRAAGHFRALGDERGQAWAAVHKARVAMRRIEVLDSMESTWALTSDAVDALDDAALEGRYFGQRCDDFVAHGLSLLYCGIAAYRRSSSQLANRERMLQAARESALDGYDLLSRSHRIPQAARCLQLAAQIAVAQSQLDSDEASAFLGDAIVSLARAVEILSDEGAFSTDKLESNVDALTAVIGSAVSAYRF